MYVIINGVSSNTLSGVQILSMPPITKPRMRTSIATIDGRPGDIVTRLGYEAYNRKIDVLLHDAYDVDEVEAFFNASGSIVFSNEPDKVYQFETIEAIDFERAVKFKKASITFHVQPYKLQYQERAETFSASPAGIYNWGNVESAPRIRINGSGVVTLSLDDNTAFVITMPDAGWIAIDAAEMNAYSGDNLANRSVIGSYDNIKLAPGRHSISWVGTVSSVVIENISRWV